MVHLILQSLELAVVIQSVWELLHQIFEHTVWNSLGRNKLVDLDVETMEKLVLLDDLLQLGLVDAQLLHKFVLQALLPLVNVLESHLILHALVVLLIDDELHERLVGNSVLVFVFNDDPFGILQMLLENPSVLVFILTHCLVKLMIPDVFLQAISQLDAVAVDCQSILLFQQTLNLECVHIGVVVRLREFKFLIGLRHHIQILLRRTHLLILGLILLLIRL